MSRKETVRRTHGTARHELNQIDIKGKFAVTAEGDVHKNAHEATLGRVWTKQARSCVSAFHEGRKFVRNHLIKKLHSP